MRSFNPRFHFRRPAQLALVTLTLIQALAFAEPKLREDQILRTPTVEQSSLTSINQAIKSLYISHPYQTRLHLPGWLNIAEDINKDFLTEKENEAIKTFIARKDVPNSQKKIWLVRYEVASPEVIASLIEAKKQGVGQVIFLTDLNNSLEGKFAANQTHHSDFKNAAFKPGGIGDRTKDLLAAGFTFDGEQYGISSQPLYDQHDDSRDPLMHEKQLFLFAGKGKPELTAFYGTANMVNLHYNRLFEIGDPSAARYAFDHAKRMRDTFTNGAKGNPAKKTMVDIDSPTPLKIVYGSGDEAKLPFQLIEFTDGKFNGNNRISDFLGNLKKNKGELHEIIFSHFVFTKTDVMNALVQALKTYPEAKLTGVFDDKFITPHGFGLAGALGGYFVNRPGGNPVYPVAYAVRSRPGMALYAFLRGKPGAHDTSLISGAPLGRSLWHDKTTLIEATVDGTRWLYAFTGSFNLSNNYHNAEMQVLYRIPADSIVAKALKETVLAVIEKEKQGPEPWIVPLDVGVFRNGMGLFAAVSPVDIPVADAQAFFEEGFSEKYKKGDLSGIQDHLDKLGKIRSQLDPTQQISATVYKERAQLLVDFLKWYNNLPAKERFGDTLASHRVLTIALLLAYPTDELHTRKKFKTDAEFEKNSAREKKEMIRSVLSYSKLTPAEAEALYRKAWTQLKIAEPFPEFKPNDRPKK